MMKPWKMNNGIIICLNNPTVKCWGEYGEYAETKSKEAAEF